VISNTVLAGARSAGDKCPSSCVPCAGRVVATLRSHQLLTAVQATELCAIRRSRRPEALLGRHAGHRNHPERPLPCVQRPGQVHAPWTSLDTETGRLLPLQRSAKQHVATVASLLGCNTPRAVKHAESSHTMTITRSRRLCCAHGRELKQTAAVTRSTVLSVHG
jgi:hypothetical protein